MRLVLSTLTAVSLLFAVPGTSMASTPRAPQAATEPTIGQIHPPTTDLKGVAPKGLKGQKNAPYRPGAIRSLTDTYVYAGGSQSVATLGVSANVTIPNPKPVVASDTYHSLVELAAINHASGSTRDIVEVGFTVDPAVYAGTANPNNVHLFVYHWVDGAESCYDGCGYVDWSGNNTQFAGMDLSAYAGQEKLLAVVYSNPTGVTGAGKWWIYFDSLTVPIGSFPESLWYNGTAGTQFNTTDQIQEFGEIATTAVGGVTCTDMGNKTYPTGSNGAARVVSTTYQGTGVPAANLSMFNTNPAYGAVLQTSPAASTKTFRYGGPGKITSPCPNP